MQLNPGTLQSNEAKLPTSLSVCHEMMWGSHCVSVVTSLSFFLTPVSYLYTIITVVLHQRHVAYLPISCILNKGKKYKFLPLH